MKDIYALLEVSWQVIYKWRNNPTTTQSRYSLKHDFIKKAGELFSLNLEEQESLAIKAGLSLHGLWGHDKKSPNIGFANHFNKLLNKYPGKKIELCKAALVSDRMFRHIKSGYHLKKEPILALLITMELGLADIQTALKKSGYFLSSSIPSDAVIIWMINNEVYCQKGAMRLHYINETLYSLNLPLLMTKIGQ